MKISSLILLLTISLLSACGGGGANYDGVVIEGEVTQGEAVDHTARGFKHGAGEPIEGIKVCALGRCSTTDAEGIYGFSAPSEYKGGDILVSIDGHGIKAETVVEVPAQVNDLYIHLETSQATEVHLHHIIIDGVETEVVAEGHVHE